MNYLEYIGTAVGILYLWLEYRASIYLWIAGIVMPAIYIFVYFDAGLYADFGINVYYLLISIYGFGVWKFGKKNADTSYVPITHTPMRQFIRLVGVFVLTLILIAIILTKFTDSNVVWWDSFTTALSIVGMWMLAKKYVEQWLVWIVVDLVSCILYIYKDLYATSALYALYTAIAYFGYLRWKKLAQST